MSTDKDRVYLEYILECIVKIKQYTKRGREYFLEDDLTQDAVLRRLQTMAESTQWLSEDFKAKFTEVDWRALSAFRNILINEYLGSIDLGRVWDIIEDYLPDFERVIVAQLELFE
jgi:uncharacterized protein with HEPN domain